ncbi:MAG: hypothetical protein ACRECQ_00900 [Burkholderiaceae bacterium]
MVRRPMLNRRQLFRLSALPHAAIAIAACGATNALAQAGNAANGATLYVQKTLIGGAQLSCQDCHGFAGTFRVSRFAGLNEAQIRARIDASIASNAGMVMGTYSAWTPQQRSDVAAHILAAPAPTPPPPFAPLPTPTASPSTVMFGSTAVGAASPVITVLLTNTAQSAVTFASPAVSPGTGQTGDFRTATVPAGQTACVNGGTLEAGSSCSIGAQFAPTAAGARTATWTVSFTGSNVPARTVTLEGTATGSSAGAAPAPTTSANAPLNAGAGALGWMQLFGLFALLGAAITRRR